MFFWTTYRRRFTLNCNIVSCNINFKGKNLIEKSFWMQSRKYALISFSAIVHAFTRILCIFPSIFLPNIFCWLTYHNYSEFMLVQENFQRVVTFCSVISHFWHFMIFCRLKTAVNCCNNKWCCTPWLYPALKKVWIEH